MNHSVILPMGKAHFRLAGRDYHDLVVTDLELDNCCIKIPLALHGAFLTEPSLEDWHLSFPVLPKARIQAKVAWVRVGGLPDPAFLEAGVNFSEVPEKYQKALKEYVDSVKNEAIAPQEYDNMPA